MHPLIRITRVLKIRLSMSMPIILLCFFSFFFLLVIFKFCTLEVSIMLKMEDFFHDKIDLSVFDKSCDNRMFQGGDVESSFMFGQEN